MHRLILTCAEIQFEWRFFSLCWCRRRHCPSSLVYAALLCADRPSALLNADGVSLKSRSLAVDRRAMPRVAAPRLAWPHLALLPEVLGRNWCPDGLFAIYIILSFKGMAKATKAFDGDDYLIGTSAELKYALLEFFSAWKPAVINVIIDSHAGSKSGRRQHKN
ncbi:hypothetical protein Ahy_B08g089302 [Arachis hypogaea]|uniref:Uncharacterized protein n=1 Tax=Arachis hypogaea TaxID=3818 RepID=A0A444XXC8_ARAHY|nr:hypothetical protein Ahy_B08g089302 [Arachis hypogaea]